MSDLSEMADNLRRHPSRILAYTEPYAQRVWGNGRSFRECFEWSKVLLDEYDWQDNHEKAAVVASKVDHYRRMVEMNVKGMAYDPQLESCIADLFPLYSNSQVSKQA